MEDLEKQLKSEMEKIQQVSTTTITRRDDEIEQLNLQVTKLQMGSIDIKFSKKQP